MCHRESPLHSGSQWGPVGSPCTGRKLHGPHQSSWQAYGMGKVGTESPASRQACGWHPSRTSSRLPVFFLHRWHLTCSDGGCHFCPFCRTMNTVSSARVWKYPSVSTAVPSSSSTRKKGLSSSIRVSRTCGVRLVMLLPPPCSYGAMLQPTEPHGQGYIYTTFLIDSTIF